MTSGRAAHGHMLVAVFTEEHEAHRVRDAAPSTADVSIAASRLLDGSAGEWVLILTGAVNAIIPALLAVRGIVESRRVKSLKLGDVEISNPSRTQVDRLLDLYEQHGFNRGDAQTLDVQDDSSA